MTLRKARQMNEPPEYLHHRLNQLPAGSGDRLGASPAASALKCANKNPARLSASDASQRPALGCAAGAPTKGVCSRKVS